MLLTKSQCESALKLAAFNNHWWAVADKEILAYLKDHENISVETIREIVLAHPDSDKEKPGILPVLNEQGEVQHTTMTGRTRWVVRPNGRVGITTNAKACPEVLISAIEPCKERIIGFEFEENRKQAQPRHYLSHISYYELFGYLPNFVKNSPESTELKDVIIKGLSARLSEVRQTIMCTPNTLINLLSETVVDKKEVTKYISDMIDTEKGTVAQLDELGVHIIKFHWAIYVELARQVLNLADISMVMSVK